MVKYKKLYWGIYGDFKKIIFISILLVGATLFIRCNKKSNDISKEKEIKEIGN